jgi:hypothetical protein
VHPGDLHAGRPGVAGGQGHRRDTEPAAHQHHRPRSGGEVETAPERTDAAHGVPLAHRKQLRRAGADRLQDHLDLVAGRPVDGERTAQQRALAQAEVDELTGLDRDRDFWGAHRDDPHVASHLAAPGYRSVNEKQGRLTSIP